MINKVYSIRSKMVFLSMQRYVSNTCRIAKSKRHKIVRGATQISWMYISLVNVTFSSLYDKCNVYNVETLVKVHMKNTFTFTLKTVKFLSSRYIEDVNTFLLLYVTMPDKMGPDEEKSQFCFFAS